MVVVVVTKKDVMECKGTSFSSKKKFIFYTWTWMLQYVLSSFINWNIVLLLVFQCNVWYLLTISTLRLWFLFLSMKICGFSKNAGGVIPMWVQSIAPVILWPLLLCRIIIIWLNLKRNKINTKENYMCDYVCFYPYGRQK